MNTADQPLQPAADEVDEAIEQAKVAAQHLRDVAPDAIDEVEPHEDVTDATSPTEVCPTEVSPTADDPQASDAPHAS